MDSVLSTECFRKIHKQATILAKISATIPSWNESKYGKILPIMEAASLAKVRRYWASYKAFADRPASEVETTLQQFLKEFRATRNSFQGQSMTAIHSAGATFMMKRDVIRTIQSAYDKFWETRVVGGFKGLLRDSNCINPMFMYSWGGNDRCIIHYGTAPCWDSTATMLLRQSTLTLGVRYQLTPTTHPCNVERKTSIIARTAILEFNCWCRCSHRLKMRQRYMSISFVAMDWNYAILYSLPQIS